MNLKCFNTVIYVRNTFPIRREEKKNINDMMTNQNIRQTS